MLEVAVSACDPREGSERLRLSLRKSAASAMAREALFGELAHAVHVASPHGGVGETMQQDGHAALVAEPAIDRECLVPTLFRGFELSNTVLHATLDTKSARDDAAVHAGGTVEERGRPLEALLGETCRPVVLERDDEPQPELALAHLLASAARMLSRSGMTRS